MDTLDRIVENVDTPQWYGALRQLAAQGALDAALARRLLAARQVEVRVIAAKRLAEALGAEATEALCAATSPEHWKEDAARWAGDEYPSGLEGEVLFETHAYATNTAALLGLASDAVVVARAHDAVLGILARVGDIRALERLLRCGALDALEVLLGRLGPAAVVALEKLAALDCRLAGAALEALAERDPDAARRILTSLLWEAEAWYEPRLLRAIRTLRDPRAAAPLVRTVRQLAASWPASPRAGGELPDASVAEPLLAASGTLRSLLESPLIESLPMEILEDAAGLPATRFAYFSHGDICSFTLEEIRDRARQECERRTRDAAQDGMRLWRGLAVTGDERNWSRLLVTIEGFAARHGAWPTRVRVPRFVYDDLKESLPAPAWKRLGESVQIAIDDQGRLEAEDAAGRRYGYGEEGLPPASATPDAAQWLGVVPEVVRTVAGGIEKPASTVATQAEAPLTGDCSCWQLPVDHTAAKLRPVGIDETAGRFAEVSVERCTRCGQHWLRYFYELESESCSGRWYMAAISGDEAASVTPENALEILGRRSWHFYGGSFFGTAGARRDVAVDPRFV